MNRNRFWASAALVLASVVMSGTPHPSWAPPGVSAATAVQETASVHLIIHAPAPEAEVWVGDQLLGSRGPVRHWTSAPLPTRETYTYVVRARWMIDDQPAEVARMIVAQPGREVHVRFPASSE